MECDYRPRDPSEFRGVLPSPEATVRIHTLGPQSPPRFRRLIEAFGEVTGMPCLVNTSFNGFHEPIVCNPRDAVRVFYGSGVDVLVLDHFLLTK
jgi:carbamoyltransferase